MKTLLMTVLLMVSGSAFALPACMTGSYFDPEQAGFGVNIEAYEKITAAYLYTFDKDFRPIWYVMVGDEVLTMSVTYVIDDKVFITREVDVGVAEIIPLADGVIRFRYTLIAEVDPDGGKLSLCRGEHCTGDFVFKQITRPIPCDK